MQAINTFTNQKDLHKEAAFLSRCIYRLKLKFRSDKGLKAMEKVNRALLNYLHVNVVEVFKTFYDMIPQKHTKIIYLPTCDLMNYILIRIQGIAKLMVRIVEESKTAALYMQNRINIGHLWQPAFICVAVVSRIFTLAKNITKYCCTLYSELYAYSKQLKTINTPWLPLTYIFPQDLKLWLDVDWLDRENLVIDSNLELLLSMNIDDSDSDIEIDKDCLILNNTKNLTQNITSKSTKIDKSNILMNILIGEDVGEAIDTSLQEKKTVERNISDNNTNLKKKSERKNKNQGSIHTTVAKIKTLKDLKEFEKQFCSAKKPKVFKKLDKLQYNMLHSNIKKCIKKGSKFAKNLTKLTACVIEAKELLMVHLK